MTTSFMGKDGFAWWHGVVESRKDPLFIGRCKVRILGWHTHDKEDMPTKSLPWAYPLMPITSASQSEVGYSPIGPVEGTWIMGFFRDGEAGQEPVMMGTLGGIPESGSKQNVGFNDPRRDVEGFNIDSIDSEGRRQPADEGTLEGVPYKPKNLILETGNPVQITEYAEDERSTYPRITNKPTTSKYARGAADSSSKVFEATGSSISSIIMNKKEKAITKFSPIPTANPATLSFAEPESMYGAVYPYNHVYESESGHLIEIDDTPGKERLHWYHRSGTFTEIHPKGTRVDRVHDDKYDMIWRNHRMKVGGNSLNNIGTNYERLSGGGSFVTAGGGSSFTITKGDYHQKLQSGSYLLTTGISESGPPPALNPAESVLGKLKAEMGSGDITIAAAGILKFKAFKIVYDGQSQERITGGSLDETVRGKASYSASSMGFFSGGEMSVVSSGNLDVTVNKAYDEKIINSLLVPGAPPPASENAKKTTAVYGKLVSECIDGAVTGGIDFNIGIGGLTSSIAMGPLAKGGSIEIVTKGALGITLDASTLPSQTIHVTAGAMAQLEAKMIKLIADAQVVIEAKIVKIADASSPAVLGDKLVDLFKEHKHGTTNGLSDVPHNASKARKIKSRAVKLS